jgi:predicted secreted acid phosphatase
MADWFWLTEKKKKEMRRQRIEKDNELKMIVVVIGWVVVMVGQVKRREG